MICHCLCGKKKILSQPTWLLLRWAAERKWIWSYRVWCIGPFLRVHSRANGLCMPELYCVVHSCTKRVSLQINWPVFVQAPGKTKGCLQHVCWYLGNVSVQIKWLSWWCGKYQLCKCRCRGIKKKPTLSKMSQWAFVIQLLYCKSAKSASCNINDHSQRFR